MESLTLKVQLFGGVSIHSDSGEISDNANRTKKVWLLLAYMIYYRNRSVSPDEMVNLLWGEEERGANPFNALKTMLHRVRGCLDQLAPGAGRALIVHRDGNYAWNSDVPVEVDIDQFDAFCRSGATADTEEERLGYLQKAVQLYQGDFLAKLSSEPWVIPIATHYHSRYVETLQQLLPLLERRGRWDEVAQLCRAAMEYDPYQEDFYRHLMNAQIQFGDQHGAVAEYERMSELFLNDFGIMPSDETRALYREAVRTVNDHTLPAGVILEQLREEDGLGGAFVCEYDIFRSVYHVMARMVTRSGDAVHLALVSITDRQGGPLAKRSLDRVVESLQELIRENLRRGDIAARCSVSQFILLLPQANFESSNMVCERIVRAFNRKHPHSPACLSTSVHPLEPNL